MKAMAQQRVAISRREELARWQPAIRRAFGFALIGLSTAGTVLGVGGGLDAVIAAPDVVMIVVSVAMAAVLTAVQWTFSATPRSPIYLGALAVSAILSTIGWGELAVPWLMSTQPIPEVAAWAIVFGVSLAMDYIPERELLD